jgi:DNA-binding response OmpR family regulator
MSNVAEGMEKPRAVQERRLLAVDDDPDIGELIARVARAEGFAVTVTSSARAFKVAFESQDPHVVILDIFMPEMDGIELVQWVIERRTNLHIIFISGNDPVFAESAMIMARELGVNRLDFLPKPVSVETLAGFLGPSDAS